MRLIKHLTPIVIGLIAVVLASFALSDTTFALTIFDGVNSARGDGQPTELFGSSGIVTTITNILLFIIGALSVIMIIIGGLRYVLSGGNSTSVTAAKNTILYAIVGLVIAFLAFSAVNFVLNSLMPGATSGYTDL